MMSTPSLPPNEELILLTLSRIGRDSTCVGFQTRRYLNGKHPRNMFGNRLAAGFLLLSAGLSVRRFETLQLAHQPTICLMVLLLSSNILGDGGDILLTQG